MKICNFWTKKEEFCVGLADSQTQLKSDCDFFEGWKKCQIVDLVELKSLKLNSGLIWNFLEDFIWEKGCWDPTGIEGTWGGKDGLS